MQKSFYNYVPGAKEEQNLSNFGFIILLILSGVIAILYYVGYRKNIKAIEDVSKALERGLNPKKKEYIWLGGALGFTGNFEVQGFKKVSASVFMLPRQSVLYYPFSLITTGYDRLEVLFFLKEEVRNEVHIIKEVKFPYKMPKIFNVDLLKKEKIKINERSFILLYKNKTKDIEAILSLVYALEPLGIMHIALTPSNRVLYVKLKIDLNLIDKIEKAMKECVNFAIKNTRNFKIS